MHDRSRTNQELIEENNLLKQKIRALELSEIQRNLALESKRTEEALQTIRNRAHQQRIAIGKLAIDDAITFGDLPTAMRRLTDECSVALQVERASVWLFSEDDETLRCASLYEAKAKQHSEGATMKSADYPRYFEAIRSESRINAGDARTDPRTREFTAGYLTPLGITSMLDAGIQIAGKLAGVVCFEHVGEQRSWHPDEEAFASTIAALVAQTLANATRKQAANALRESEERYRTLVENANDIIFKADTTGCFTFVNPAGICIAGYEEKDLIGKQFWTLIRPDMREEAIKFFGRQFVKELQTTYYEFPIITKDGREIWLGQNTSLLVENGRVSGFQAMARNITDRKQVEKALKDSEAQYRLLADNMRDQVWLMDLNLKPTYISPSVEKSRGYTFEEIAQLPLDKHLTATSFQSAMEYFSIEIAKALADPTYFARPLEIEFYRKDGSTLWVESTFSLIRDENGKPLSLLGVGREITDRKKAEQEIALLGDIGRLIGSTLNIDEVYERFANEVRKLIAFDRMVVNLNNLQGGILSCVYVYGMDIAGRKLRETFPLTRTVNELLIRTRKGLVVQSTSLEELADQYPSLISTFQAGMRSMMSIPLIVRDEVIGGLHFRAMKPNCYTAETLDLAERIGAQIAGAIANAQLFNDLSNTEKSLRESERQFRRLADNMQDLVMEVDTKGIIQYVSPSSRYLGYAPAELIGQLCFNVLHPEDKDKIAGLFAEALENPLSTPSLPPYRVITKNGGFVWIEGYGAALFDEDQQLIGGLIVGRDITDRKHAEEKLRESEEKYRNILESIEEGYFEVDLAGNITFF
ncbi:MAG: PAS domain S-box protein, partial [Syntrophales bacterium]